LVFSEEPLRCRDAPLWRSRLRAFSRWPSHEARGWVVAFAERVCPDPNTKALVAIGSFVRPVKQVNDVDLVYFYASQRPPYEAHPLDVDLRIYDAKKIPSMITAGHDVLSWAIRFGRVICEHDRFWSDLCSQWNNRIPLPDPRAAEKRAEKTARILQQVSSGGDVDAAEEIRLSLLTHKAWAYLLRQGVHPRSRPELPAQLREAQNFQLATELEALIHTIDEASGSTEIATG
jgi:hypothetical protein